MTTAQANDIKEFFRQEISKTNNRFPKMENRFGEIDNQTNKVNNCLMERIDMAGEKIIDVKKSMTRSSVGILIALFISG